VGEWRCFTSLTLIDEADSVPAIKPVSTKRNRNFIVLIADRCKVVVLHAPDGLFNCSFCVISYTIGTNASERQVNSLTL
jgi:hypothetical protein